MEFTIYPVYEFYFKKSSKICEFRGARTAFGVSLHFGPAKVCKALIFVNIS